MQSQIYIPTQLQRMAISALDPEEVLRVARKDYALQRLFRRENAHSRSGEFDGLRALSVDHLDIMACLGIGANIVGQTMGTTFRKAPWMTDSSVTSSWVVEPKFITFGTGNGIATLAPEKGSISLVQGGGASKEPQYVASGGWGNTELSCATFDGTAQHWTGDAVGAAISGNDVPCTFVFSYEQATPSGGAVKYILAAANTSDANSWHTLSQEQVAAIEVYRSRRADASLFTALNSTHPYPTTASLSARGYWRHVITWLFTGTTTTVRVDGITSSISAGAQNVNSYTLSKFTVGAFRGATTSGYTDMRMRRMIFGASAFSAGTYQAAENYMRQENSPVGSTKKGIVCEPTASAGYPSKPDPALGGIQMLNATWYSNYTVTPWGTPSSFTAPIAETAPALTEVGSAVSPGVEFVPMLPSLAVADSAQNRAWAQAYGTNLLTINEPDAAGSSTPCVSVANVISRWSTIRAMGMTTGAPAVTANADVASGWLHDFMTDASAPVVDFIPLHRYIVAADFADPTAATSHTLSYISGCYTLYTKPIWLHEFNAIQFGGPPWTVPTVSQMNAILQRLIPWLEATASVARYSLYSMHCPLIGTPGTSFESIGCVKDDGSMPATTIGQVYADLGRF